MLFSNNTNENSLPCEVYLLVKMSQLRCILCTRVIAVYVKRIAGSCARSIGLFGNNFPICIADLNINIIVVYLNIFNEKFVFV